MVKSKIVLQDYYYFTIKSCGVSIQYNNNVLNKFAINESKLIHQNKKNLVNFNWSLQSTSTFEFKKIVYFVIFSTFRMLRNTYQHVDYKSTIEFVVNTYFNNYLNTHSADLVAQYSSYQLQLIKNKKMQNSWMKRNSIQWKLLNKYAKHDKNWYSGVSPIRGLQLSVKGRAADLRWVKLRFLQSGILNSMTKNYKFFKSWKSEENFVTKWGSINIIASITMNKQQNHRYCI